MIYLVQLEPLEERYTEQWARWIPAGLDANNIRYKVIEGEKLTSRIETGDVLDVYGTHYWRMEQIKKLLKLLRDGKIKDGDTIWFADLWAPGIEALAYARSMTGINFKITGVLHAGTWDKYDFLNRHNFKSWAVPYEHTIFNIADEIYLGSAFHKEMIKKFALKTDYNQMVSLGRKLKVTGLFFDYQEVRKQAGFEPDNPNAIREDKLVVFPHRIAPEKRPDLFIKTSKDTHLAKEGFSFLHTKHHCKTKTAYYRLLRKAAMMISFKGQETFGYSVRECMALGVIPFVYNGMNYPEFMPSEFRYTTWEQLKSKILFSRSFKKDLATKMEKILEETTPERVAAKMFKQ